MILLLASIIAFGQNDTSHIKMVSDPSSSNSEFKSLLLFQNIDYHKVKFIGNGLSSKYFTVLVKEMWDGEVKKIDTLINSKVNKKMGTIGSDTLYLSLLASKVENNKLKFFFRFPMVGMTRKYEGINSDDYSLRDIGIDLKIEKNKFFPAFAYILPYVEGNWKMYCAVDKSGINVEDWGKKFKIKHYLIFEIKFED